MARRPNKLLTEYCSSFRAVGGLSLSPYSLKQKGETRLYWCCY
ncbi:hypothetical protein VPHK459_0031 [Vibrio phage K459]